MRINNMFAAVYYLPRNNDYSYCGKALVTICNRYVNMVGFNFFNNRNLHNLGELYAGLLVFATAALQRKLLMFI